MNDSIPQRALVRTLLWIVAGTALAGCAGGVELPDPEEGTTDVLIENLAFSPRNVTINRGERVRWINAESGAFPILHTSTSGDPGDPDEGALWDSGTLSPGETFSQQFDEVGEFVYFCEVHRTDPDMRGATVTVVEPGSQP